MTQLDPRMAAMREALLAQQAKKEARDRGEFTGTRKTGSNAMFQFWSMKKGETTTIRFLPDGNPDNMWFWKDREVIKIPFSGVVGGQYPSTSPAEVTVTCMRQFGERCKIQDLIDPLWDSPYRDYAFRYWVNRTHIYQGLVIETPVREDEAPENPIRRFSLTSQLHNIIKNSLTDPEMTHSPSDILGGRDFRVKLTDQGGNNNYTTSGWAFSQRPLSDAEQAVVSQYGLEDLSKFVGEPLTEEQIEALPELLRDSMMGKPFDYAKFGHLFRAFKITNNNAKDKLAKLPLGMPAEALAMIQFPTSGAAPVAATQVAQQVAAAPVYAQQAAPVAAAPVYEQQAAPVAPVAPVGGIMDQINAAAAATTSHHPAPVAAAPVVQEAAPAPSIQNGDGSFATSAGTGITMESIMSRIGQRAPEGE